jgi:3-oxoacyl-[acyl-carrier protein] reductase
MTSSSPSGAADRFLVTGCASGIGLELATRLSRKGHRVMATDVNQEALERAAAAWSDRVFTARLDVTDVDSWRSVLEMTDRSWNGLDVLYNVAGYLAPGWVHELALEDVERHFDINTKGVIYGTRLVAERMVAQGCGHIVNIASMAALAPVPGLSLYSASKYAVRAFSLAAAIELARTGVAVTVVCPDAVATPMLDKQKGHAAAALTFTAPKILTVTEVVDALTGPVLRHRPMELAMPLSRKLLARIVDVVPPLARWVEPLLQKHGRAQQRKADP